MISFTSTHPNLLLQHLLEDTNDGEVSGHANFSQLFVNHEAEDTHHGGTSVVQFNSTLGELGFFVKSVPAKVKGSVTEVTREVTRGGTIGRVLHDSQFKETNKGKDLEGTSRRDGIRAKDGCNTVGVGVKGVTRKVNVSSKVDTITGGDLAKEGKLTDTSVLDFDVTKAVELEAEATAASD